MSEDGPDGSVQPFTVRRGRREQYADPWLTTQWLHTGISRFFARTPRFVRHGRRLCFKPYGPQRTKKPALLQRRNPAIQPDLLTARLLDEFLQSPQPVVAGGR